MKLRYIIIVMVLGLFLACGGSEKPKAESVKKEVPSAKPAAVSAAPSSSASNTKGKLIFKQYCIVCHGADGKLAVSGAKDLSISKLSKEERILQVTNGKGLMTPYKDILSAEQIANVVDYLEELRN